MNIKQFVVVMMNVENGIIHHFLNCNNEFSAMMICKGLFPDMRLIEIRENT